MRCSTNWLKRRTGGGKSGTRHSDAWSLYIGCGGVASRNRNRDAPAPAGDPGQLVEQVLKEGALALFLASSGLFRALTPGIVPGGRSERRFQTLSSLKPGGARFAVPGRRMGSSSPRLPACPVGSAPSLRCDFVRSGAGVPCAESGFGSGLEFRLGKSGGDSDRVARTSPSATGTGSRSSRLRPRLPGPDAFGFVGTQVSRFRFRLRRPDSASPHAGASAATDAFP